METSDKDIIGARLCYAFSAVDKQELSSQGRIDMYVATLESMLTYLEFEGMAITAKEARAVSEDLRLQRRLYTEGPYVLATVAGLGHSARPSDLLSREKKAQESGDVLARLDRIIELLEKRHE